ncbi:N-acyl homoserine lactonase family protein [Pseudonocardia pini]|uniref:N-acyl homoserine lactonase family protein n=1 Tax=Pseudonocardia pini TaxID=2758030 RepID=UPI0015F0C50E|nr:N-acyl homoserine lactonase family protein [Pseudonocardia pini]
MTLLDVGESPEMRVFAIRFAHRTRSTAREHFYRSHSCGEEAKPISYYVWLVAGRGRRILVDAGFTQEVARRRGDRHYLACPLDSLGALGVEPDTIDTVVLTHLHYDHTGLVSAFPSARITVQQRELDYWTGPLATRGENPHLVEAEDLAALGQLVRGGRVNLVDGDAHLADGVRAHLTGGHTAGLQTVSVQAGGGPVVLASDASHFYDNVEQDRPYSIVDSLPAMYAAFDRMKAETARGGHLVPGHDPRVVERYPAVPGTKGHVVEIR